MKTYEDVVRILSPIEPTEDMYAAITLEDLAHLQRLSHDAEPWRAARAVFAASRLRGLAANNLVIAAARDPGRSCASRPPQVRPSFRKRSPIRCSSP